MLVLTPTQAKIYKYIKEGKFKGWDQATADLELSKTIIHRYVKLMEAHGLIERQPMYKSL